MEKTLLNNFFFDSEIFGVVAWGWNDDCVYEANNHKTFKPKLSDLNIKTKLSIKHTTKVRRELYEDLMLEYKIKQKPTGIFAHRKN